MELLIPINILILIGICCVAGPAKRAERNSRRLNEIMEIVFREHLDAENRRILDAEAARQQAAEERRRQRVKERKETWHKIKGKFKKEDTTLEDYEDWKENRH